MPNQTIKILSWNVENLRLAKVNKIANIIKQYDPDVFAIYEVTAKLVYDFILAHFPDYSIFLTKGYELQELIVACRNNFQGIKFQQKNKFQVGNPSLRPGVFLTFKFPGKGKYAFLFLHTDSGTGAPDFGNRNEMFVHAFNLKRLLDKLENSAVNMIILGDLNTMGLKYPRQWKSDQIVQTLNELDFIDYQCMAKGEGRYKNVIPNMRRLTKPVGTHYSKKYGISDLDHIIASNHLEFVQQNNPNSGNFEIMLDGWIKFTKEEDIKKFTDEISDHCLLFCELIVK